MKNPQIVVTKETAERYDRVWRLAQENAALSVASKEAYWQALYEIRRDELWRADPMFAAPDSVQEDWISYLGTLPEWEGGVTRTLFFRKTDAIERLEKLHSVPIEKAVFAVVNTPAAVERILDAKKNEKSLPSPTPLKSVETVIDEIAEMNPFEAIKHVDEKTCKTEVFVSRVDYFDGEKWVTLSRSSSENVPSEVVRIYLTVQKWKWDEKDQTRYGELSYEMLEQRFTSKEVFAFMMKKLNWWRE